MTALDDMPLVHVEGGWIDTKDRSRFAAVEAMRVLSRTMDCLADALDYRPDDIAGFNALDTLAVQQLQQFRAHLDRYGGLRECDGEA